MSITNGFYNTTMCATYERLMIPGQIKRMLTRVRLCRVPKLLLKVLSILWSFQRQESPAFFFLLGTVLCGPHGWWFLIKDCLNGNIVLLPLSCSKVAALLLRHQHLRIAWLLPLPTTPFLLSSNKRISSNCPSLVGLSESTWLHQFWISLFWGPNSTLIVTEVLFG